MIVLWFGMLILVVLLEYSNCYVYQNVGLLFTSIVFVIIDTKRKTSFCICKYCVMYCLCCNETVIQHVVGNSVCVIVITQLFLICYGNTTVYTSMLWLNRSIPYAGLFWWWNIFANFAFLCFVAKMNFAKVLPCHTFLLVMKLLVVQLTLQCLGSIVYWIQTLLMIL